MHLHWDFQLLEISRQTFIHLTMYLKLNFKLKARRLQDFLRETMFKLHRMCSRTNEKWLRDISLRADSLLPLLTRSLLNTDRVVWRRKMRNLCLFTFLQKRLIHANRKIDTKFRLLLSLWLRLTFEQQTEPWNKSSVDSANEFPCFEVTFQSCS